MVYTVSSYCTSYKLVHNAEKNDGYIPTILRWAIELVN